MPTFKYQINDRVKERQSNRIHGGYINKQGTHKLIKTRKGVVKGVNLKKNSAGATWLIIKYFGIINHVV